MPVRRGTSTNDMERFMRKISACHHRQSIVTAYAIWGVGEIECRLSLLHICVTNMMWLAASLRTNTVTAHVAMPFHHVMLPCHAMTCQLLQPYHSTPRWHHTEACDTAVQSIASLCIIAGQGDSTGQVLPVEGTN